VSLAQGYEREWRDLANLFEPSGRGQKTVVMILAYIDDSGNEDQEVMSFCGYLARRETWIKIKKKWRKALRKYHVADFHMRELAFFRGDAEGWTEEYRRDFFAECAEVIRDRALMGLGCGFYMEDFKNSGLPGLGKSAYNAAAHGTINLLLNWKERLRPRLKYRVGEHISFIFD
jgi:hypothetical protein